MTATVYPLAKQSAYPLKSPLKTKVTVICGYDFPARGLRTFINSETGSLNKFKNRFNYLNKKKHKSEAKSKHR